MEIEEIYNKYWEMRKKVNEELEKIREEERNALEKSLEELNLAGMVRRKGNGHIGKLSVSYSYGGNRIEFYPLTKKGEISKRNEYFYYQNVETEFEPYTGGDKE